MPTTTTIQSQQVIDTIEENLNALRQIDYGKLLKQEKEELKTEFSELEKLALSIKEKFSK